MRWLLVFLVVLTVPAKADPGDAWIVLPTPSGEEVSEFHRQIGMDPAAIPAGEELANSLRACFYRPEVAPLMIRMEWATRATLSKRVYWILAVAVSGRNRCDYCLSAFGAGLLKETGDGVLLEDLVARPLEASLTAPERAAVAYALRLTSAPSELTSEAVGELRAAGWSDRQIYEIALVTSWCNFMNRMALGLGYGPDKTHPFEER